MCIAYRSGGPSAEWGGLAGPLTCESQLYAAKAYCFSMPLQIRTEVLKMLQALPIDLTDEQRKGQMKKSQIGHVVMFLSKPEVENNRSNRRIARVGAGFSSRCSPLHCVSPVAIARPCCKQLRVHAWKQRRSNCGPAYAFLLACQCLCSPPTFTCFGSSFRC